MLSTTVAPSKADAQRLDAARRDFLAWPLSKPRDLGVTRAEFDGIVAGLADVPLASADDVASVASVFGSLTASAQVDALSGFSDAGGVSEGRTWHLGISAGVVSLRSFDAARAEKTAGRAVRRAESVVNEVVSRAVVPCEGPLLLPVIDPDRVLLADELLPKDAYGSEVVEWSAKSRARMVKTLAQLDLSTWKDDGGDLGMLTLSLPGDWQAVAPDGKTFKRAVEKFRRRFVRATGKAWRVIWKLEFQDRGAPHMHLLMRIPALVEGEAFTAWCSRTWADCVEADDFACHGLHGLYKMTPLHADGAPRDECGCAVPDTERARHLRAGTGVDFAGSRYRDPRRIALYFLGHSTKHTDGKEYQHRVPLLWQGRGKGPGRFWGYSGLSTAVVEVELTLAEAMVVRRMLRKVHATRNSQRDRARVARGLPPLARRKVWTLGSSGAMSGGWVLSNDALALAYDIGRYLQERQSWSDVR